EPLRALLEDLVARRMPARAVDRDAADGEQSPAHEGQPQQLLLHDPALRREARLEEKRFPRGLVLREDHHRTVGNVLPAAHLVADAARPFDPFEDDRGVEAGERARGAETEESAERDED